MTGLVGIFTKLKLNYYKCLNIIVSDLISTCYYAIAASLPAIVYGFCCSRFHPLINLNTFNANRILIVAE